MSVPVRRTSTTPYFHHLTISSSLTIVVLNEGGGLGRLMSKQFAKRGCILVLWDINKEGNEETAEEVRRLGASAYTYVCDLSQREDVYKNADMVLKLAQVTNCFT